MKTVLIIYLIVSVLFFSFNVMIGVEVKARLDRMCTPKDHIVNHSTREERFCGIFYALMMSFLPIVNAVLLVIGLMTHEAVVEGALSNILKKTVSIEAED